jgi:hypothetical protein
LVTGDGGPSWNSLQAIADVDTAIVFEVKFDPDNTERLYLGEFVSDSKT